MAAHNTALLLKFKNDTLATVSRTSVKMMARKLGFNETQVAHYALARLREELSEKSVRPVTVAKHTGTGRKEVYPPLTADQLAVIREHVPKRRGKPLTSDSLFTQRAVGQSKKYLHAAVTEAKNAGSVARSSSTQVMMGRRKRLK